MAKLTARGRTELARLSIVEVPNDSTITRERTRMVALMSDGNVLEKIDVVFVDGKKHSYGWKVKVAAKKLDLSCGEFTAAYEAKGYVRCSSSR